MIIYTVLSITFLYFLFAVFSDFIKRIVGKKVCAICAAIGLTWLALLILKLLGFDIDILIIGILMGQSVIDLIYKLEKKFKKQNWQKFWLVRILIITGGTPFVYWLLKEHYTLSFLLLFLEVALLLVIVSIGKMEDPKGPRDSKDYQRAVAKLEKMMEDCC